MKILLTTTSFQDTPGKHHDLLRSQNWDIDYLRGPLKEDLIMNIVHQYDGIICGDDEYTKKVLIAGKQGKLKVISKYGVGLDKIDLKAAKELGIKVTNCPGVNQVSVAEHVLALLFTFEKNIHLQYNSVRKGSWKRLIGNEVEGKTIGIIGLGSIGKELAKKSIALGLNVICFDLVKDEKFISKTPEIKFTDDIDLIYKNADIISLNIPHTPLTNKIINSDAIVKFKKNVILINTSRGMIIDVNDVIDGLTNGKIRGYLTDVLVNEPIETNEKLNGLDNVIITPHIGSRTYQSVVKQGCMAVKNLSNMLI